MEDKIGALTERLDDIERKLNLMRDTVRDNNLSTNARFAAIADWMEAEDAEAEQEKNE